MESLGERIKRYEATSNHTLTPRSPVIIRVDGQHFHTYTRGADKPYDRVLMASMVYAAEKTAAAMSGFKIGYVQSDEATFLITDYDKLETQGWFGYELNKLVSISAAHFTAHFNFHIQFMKDQKLIHDTKFHTIATFDSRAFTVPREDVPNVFVWRQQDWYRNSVQMLAQSHWSQKQLHGKNLIQLKEMLAEIGDPWERHTAREKCGTFVLPGGGMIQRYLNYEEINEWIENGTVEPCNSQRQVSV